MISKLLVSGYDFRSQQPGGLFGIDTNSVPTRLDDRNVSGMTVKDNQLSRVLWSSSRRSQLLIGDNAPIDINVFNPHDVTWDGELLAVVDTGHNRVVWFDRNGIEQKSWQPNIAEDSWHLGALAWVGTDLAVTYFGKYNEKMGWAGKQATHEAGMDVIATNQTILSGLAGPHSPRFIDGKWHVLNSYEKMLVRIAPDGKSVEKSLTLQGWPRGMASDSTYIYVGISTPRPERLASSRTYVAVVDKTSWEIEQEISIDVSEIYEVLVHG